MCQKLINIRTNQLYYFSPLQELDQRCTVQHAQISTKLSSMLIPIASPELQIRAYTMIVLYHGCGIGHLKTQHDVFILSTTVKRALNVLISPIISARIRPISMSIFITK